MGKLGRGKGESGKERQIEKLKGTIEEKKENWKKRKNREQKAKNGKLIFTLPSPDRRLCHTM